MLWRGQKQQFFGKASPVYIGKHLNQLDRSR
jgi:hypothetical protein